MGEFVSFEELMKSDRVRFIAEGDTFQYRNEFLSRSWHWDSLRRVWVNENETGVDSYCIHALLGLPGVTIKCEGPVE